MVLCVWLEVLNYPRENKHNGRNCSSRFTVQTFKRNPLNKPLNDNRMSKTVTNFSVGDNITPGIYIHCNQSSNGVVRMYLCSPPVPIVSNQQYDVSCKEMLDLHRKFIKLWPNCPRGVVDLLTSGCTSITAVGMVKNVVRLKFWKVSKTLLHIYVLIFRIIISNWRDTVRLSFCILWGSAASCVKQCL
jgi:hypothetical protein